jgi:methionyl-tRNA formyltransferase
VTTLTTAFAGSPEFAKNILHRLQDSPFAPAVVLTQPDRPKGRGRKLQANPVKTLAQEANIPVLQPINFKAQESLAALAEFNPDVLIVAAYGLILPPSVLALPKFGCINVHASLLPRWRGAAPIERAIMAGDTATGVGIMQMEKGLDTGPIFAERELTISAQTSVLQLEQQLALSGAELLIDVLGHLPMNAQPQNEEGVTYASKLTAEDRRVHWHSSAIDIERQIRALADRMPVTAKLPEVEVQFLAASVLDEAPTTAAPGTLLIARKGRLIVQCGTGQIQIDRLRINKGKGLPMDTAAAINGFQRFLPEGAQFDANDLVDPNL